MTGTAGGLRGGAPRSLTNVITATGNGSLDINALIASGYSTLRCALQAAGIGGGSGRRGAAGSVRGGGGPGAPGGFVPVEVSLAELLALFPTGLVPYNVGPGTAGGAAVAVDDTNGNPGSAAVTATNATWLGAVSGALSVAIAYTGAAGAGGTSTGGSAGATPFGAFLANAGTGSSTSGAAGAQVVRPWAGPGGGITVADAPGNGSGGQIGLAGNAAGSAGVVGGAAPTSGTAPAVTVTGPGSGPGGGAASIVGAAQAGAAALPNSGNGGGGGGASLNGNLSGAGGAGGSGFLRYTAS